MVPSKDDVDVDVEGDVEIDVEQELKSLVRWILTFPSMDVIVESYPLHLDLDLQTEVTSWLNEKDVATAILHVSNEIMDGEDTGQQGDDLDVEVIWDLIYDPDPKCEWSTVPSVVGTVTKRHAALCHLLCAAIGSENKEVYIGRILSTDRDIQCALMTVIERHRDDMNNDNDNQDVNDDYDDVDQGEETEPEEEVTDERALQLASTSTLTPTEQITSTTPLTPSGTMALSYSVSERSSTPPLSSGPLCFALECWGSSTKSRSSINTVVPRSFTKVSVTKSLSLSTSSSSSTIQKGSSTTQKKKKRVRNATSATVVDDALALCKSSSSVSTSCSTRLFSPHRKRRLSSGTTAHPTKSSSSRKSAAAALSPPPPDKLDELDHKVEHLETENKLLKEVVERSRKIEQDYAVRESARRSHDLDFEKRHLEVMDSIREKHQEEMQELRRKSELLEITRKELLEQKKNASEMRDEIDVLTHWRQKAETTEELCQKYRQKLQELTDVADALKQEEEARAEAVERCIELENKLERLSPLQKQVVAYRSRATDAEVRAAELEEKLQKTLRRVDELEEAQLLMQKELSVQQQQQQPTGTTTDLLAIADDIVEDGVGNAINELNPALKEELVRLRNENQQLTIYKQETSQDFVVELKDRLQDSNELATTFKDKYFATQNELHDTQKLLSESKGREHQLKQTIQQKQKEIKGLHQDIQNEKDRGVAATKEAQETLTQTTKSLKTEAELERKALIRKHEQLLEEERETAQAKAQADAQTLEETKRECAQKISHTQTSCEERLDRMRQDIENRLKKARADHEEDMKQAQDDAKNEREHLVSMGKDLFAKKKAAFNTKIRQSRQELQAVVSSYQEYRESVIKERDRYQEQSLARIASLKHQVHVGAGRQRDLEQSLDELRQKKKALEREKKELTEENDRYKRHVRSGAGSHTLETQYNTLRQEFNKVMEENRSLKKENQQYRRRQRKGELRSVLGDTNIHNDTTLPHNNSNNASIMSSIMGRSGDLNNSLSINTSFANGIDDDKENNVFDKTKKERGIETLLSNLKEEHSNELSAMNDERRELIMKNSAAVCELQRANQRSWELQEDLDKVKAELSSTRLALQRHEHSARLDAMEFTNLKSSFVLNTASSTSFSTDEPNQPTASFDSMTSHTTTTSPQQTPQVVTSGAGAGAGVLTPRMEGASASASFDSTSTYPSQTNNHPNTTTPSNKIDNNTNHDRVVTTTLASSTNSEGNPECRQS